MEKRITDIEEVIDHHFDLIKQTIYQNKADKIEKQNKKYEEEAAGGKTTGNKSNRAGTSMRSNRNSASSKNAENKKKVESELQKQIEQNVIKEQLANDPELQFDNKFIYTYEKKLETLDRFEEDLLKNDKLKKENRRGFQTICRIQGSIA